MTDCLLGMETDSEPIPAGLNLKHRQVHRRRSDINWWLVIEKQDGQYPQSIPRI